ncbi:unnamed protein product [Diamesa serratosioi]
MVFICQTDSFLKEYLAKVEKIEKTDDGKQFVIFNDTVLFPEGGGQPTDHGTITLKSDESKKLRVTNVIRRGAEALHFLDGSDGDIKVGDEVLQEIDWIRREDHMQQHSGQHLISAVFEREYNCNSIAWWLGTETSYIEVDVKTITEAEVKRVEEMCNAYIARALPVNVKVYKSAEDPTIGDEITRATKGLPIDLAGPIRVINIEGVDSNMCCGTHVTNLAQLQMIKMLNIERMKNKTLIHFLVGKRVLKRFDSIFERELQFTQILNGGPATHVDLVKKIQVNYKSSQKTVQKLSKELATKEAEKYNNDTTVQSYVSLHRNDGVDMDFANTFMRNLKAEKTLFLFITISEVIDGKSGSLLLQGDPEDIKVLGDPICKLLDGKGNGKNNRFQAKVLNLNKIKDCEILIKNHFTNK